LVAQPTIVERFSSSRHASHIDELAVWQIIEDISREELAILFIHYISIIFQKPNAAHSFAFKPSLRSIEQRFLVYELAMSLVAHPPIAIEYRFVAKFADAFVDDPSALDDDFGAFAVDHSSFAGELAAALVSHQPEVV